MPVIGGRQYVCLERSVRAYRINKFLHTQMDPVARAAFRADEAVAMRAARLSDVERTRSCAATGAL